MIESFPTALPWATAFVRQARRLDARPLLLYEDERSYWDAIASGHVDALGQPGASEWAALESADVYVYFWGPEDHRRRQRLPPEIRSRSTAFNMRWYDRARKRGIRGARMEIAKVTEANARFYGVSARRWRAALIEATMRDPRSLRRRVRRVDRMLRRGRELHLTAPGGTDLTLALDHGPIRTFDGCRLRAAPRRWRFAAMATIPSAAVVTRHDTRVAEGTFVANRPSYLGSGVARGGHARFSGGRLLDFGFRQGGAGPREAYAAASRGRDVPGFIEVGLDPALEAIPDLEDCEAGAVTLGIGANTGWGGSNRSTFMTWMVVGGGTLSVDGNVVVRSGQVL